MNFQITQGLSSLKDWFVRQVIYEKLNNPLGYVLALSGAFALAFVSSMLPLKMAVLFVGGLVAIPIVAVCFLNLHFGVNVMLVVGFLLGLAYKYTNAPIGTALDGMLVLMLISLLARLIKEKDLS